MSFYEIRSIMNSSRKHNRFSSIQWLLLALPLMSLLNRTVKENALSLISILFSMKLVKCKTMNMSIPGTFFAICVVVCVRLRAFQENSTKGASVTMLVKRTKALFVYGAIKDLWECFACQMLRENENCGTISIERWTVWRWRRWLWLLHQALCETDSFP